MTDTPSTGPRQRPLSPHLQVYRLQMTSATSILHRITGFGLALGAGVVAWWLLAAATGPGAYTVFHAAAKSILGQVVLFCFLLALVYHFLNGIRHMCWDMVVGVDIKNANRTGVAIILGSIALSAAIWGWM